VALLLNGSCKYPMGNLTPEYALVLGRAEVAMNGHTDTGLVRCKGGLALQMHGAPKSVPCVTSFTC
jgi:hypothetical protein